MFKAYCENCQNLILVDNPICPTYRCTIDNSIKINLEKAITCSDYCSISVDYNPTVFDRSAFKKPFALRSEAVKGG